jgi:hypothetical protein
MCEGAPAPSLSRNELHACYSVAFGLFLEGLVPFLDGSERRQPVLAPPAAPSSSRVSQWCAKGKPPTLKLVNRWLGKAPQNNKIGAKPTKGSELPVSSSSDSSGD